MVMSCLQVVSSDTEKKKGDLMVNPDLQTKNKEVPCLYTRWLAVRALVCTDWLLVNRSINDIKKVNQTYRKFILQSACVSTSLAKCIET